MTFDIEANDHPDKNPLMIELGWCLFDAQGRILTGYPKSHLVQPIEDFGPIYVDPTIKDEIHGLSFEKIQQEGKPFIEEVVYSDDDNDELTEV